MQKSQMSNLMNFQDEMADLFFLQKEPLRSESVKYILKLSWERIS